MYPGAHALFPGAILVIFGERWTVRSVDRNRQIIAASRGRAKPLLLDITAAGALRPVDPRTWRRVGWAQTAAEFTDWFTMNPEAMPERAYERDDTLPIANDPNSVFTGFGMWGPR